MTLKITHKNSTSAGTPPAAGDIDVGEIAINAADAKLYVKDIDGNIRAFANADTPSSAANVNFTQAGTGAVERTVEAKLQDFVTVKDFNGIPSEAIALAAYTNRSLLYVDSSSSLKLVCDPTNGDDFQDMCSWISSGHHIEQGGELYIEIADGLHNVSTYVDLVGSQSLDMRGSSGPTSHTITGITISAVGSDIYNATVSVSSALPDYVVAGYAIGCRNVKGDNGAESINGAHIVTSVAANRLSFTFQYYSFGVIPTTPTTINTATTLGMAGSQVVVPRCCIRANSSGWDGAAREGFINCIDGGKLSMQNVGISFNGVNGPHDILFAKGAGSYIDLNINVVIAGAGSFVLRLAYGGALYANLCLFGTGIEGRQIIQGIFSSNAQFVRCCMGGAQQGALVPTVSCYFGVTQCVIASCNYALRPTYRDSTISYLNARITHCDTAAWSQGRIVFDNLASIRLCTTPLLIEDGTIHGNPSISENTNATIDPFVQLGDGSAWYPRNSEAVTANATNINIKGAEAGAQVANFESFDATTTTICKFARGGAAVAAEVIYAPNLINFGTTTNHVLEFIQNSTPAARIDTLQRFLVGLSSAGTSSALLQVGDDRIRIVNSHTPASAGATGTAGEISWDSDYIYVCTAANTWKRAALSTW